MALYYTPSAPLTSINPPSTPKDLTIHMWSQLKCIKLPPNYRPHKLYGGVADLHTVFTEGVFAVVPADPRSQDLGICPCVTHVPVSFSEHALFTQSCSMLYHNIVSSPVAYAQTLLIPDHFLPLQPAHPSTSTSPLEPILHQAACFLRSRLCSNLASKACQIGGVVLRRRFNPTPL